MIAAQSDGVWVSLWGADAIAHISGDGEYAEIPLEPGAEPHGMAIGPTTRSGSPARRATSSASASAPRRRSLLDRPHAARDHVRVRARRDRECRLVDRDALVPLDREPG